MCGCPQDQACADSVKSEAFPAFRRHQVGAHHGHHGSLPRNRLAQLESQVTQLTRIVNNIESQLGGNPSQIITSGDGCKTGRDDSEGESSASEILVAEQPSHMRSLFQNDLLSVAIHPQEEQLQERREKGICAFVKERETETPEVDSVRR